MDIKFLSISTFVRRAQKQETNNEHPQGGAKQVFHPWKLGLRTKNFFKKTIEASNLILIN